MLGAGSLSYLIGLPRTIRQECLLLRCRSSPPSRGPLCFGLRLLRRRRLRPRCAPTSSSADYGSISTQSDLLPALMLPDFDRGDRNGEFWSRPAQCRPVSQYSEGPSSRSTSTEASDIIGRWRRRFIQAVGEASASVT